VIVTCERCETRFQLDEARIPASGARVRCSRCKHAFRIAAPGASQEQAVHALAEEAAEREATPAPEASEDLERTVSAAAPASMEASSEDEEWQFAEQERGAPRSSQPEPVADPWRGVLEEEKPPESLELDALGSPETWSFVSEEAPSTRPALEPPVRKTAAPPARRPAASGRGQEPVAEPTTGGRLHDGVGLAATLLLLAALVLAIPWRGHAPPLATTLAAPDGVVVEELSVRRLENRASGPLLVVEGVLVNPGSERIGLADGLALELLDDHGRALGAAAPLGRPRSTEALREGDLVPVSGTTRGALEPGARVPFQAVVVQPPTGALHLTLRTLRPAAGAAGLWPGEAWQPRTSPSPPSPPPSSG